MIALEYIAHGYICTRQDGKLYLMGRVCDWNEGYEYKEGDLFMPFLGGILVPQALQEAIINGEFNGRLVPYEMTKKPYLIDEDMLRTFDPATQRLTIKEILNHE